MKDARDEIEGVDPGMTGLNDQDRIIIERYGRWDINGDGLEEDVIFWVAKDSRVLLKAAMLTEMYPGLPIMRPFTSESFEPVPNRVCGMSLSMILEPLQGAMHDLMNQHIDWGTIVNFPFFFYRASSGMKPEPLRLEPGEGVPLDDPSRDVSFPQFAQRDSAYTLNTMTLLQQFVERLSTISDAQLGRVPPGRASALRTVGTTMALLGQGNERSEQVLRRLLSAFAKMFQQMHRLNKRFLPDKKEIRIFGLPERGEDAYVPIGPSDIEADVDFEFKATMLNTNKQMLVQSLQETAGLLVSPLMIQLGIVSAEEIYVLMRDIEKAKDHDPDRYMKRPPNFMETPKLMAEDAMSAILANQMPEGRPLEPAIEHMQKLVQFTQIPQFGLLNEVQVGMFKAWLTQVQTIVQQEQQQQLLAQAAQEQQARSNGGGQPGAPAQSVQDVQAQPNPQVERNELIDETIGAT
jgi:hypothetical protein